MGAQGGGFGEGLGSMTEVEPEIQGDSVLGGILPLVFPAFPPHSSTPRKHMVYAFIQR